MMYPCFRHRGLPNNQLTQLGPDGLFHCHHHLESLYVQLLGENEPGLYGVMVLFVSYWLVNHFYTHIERTFPHIGWRISSVQSRPCTHTHTHKKPPTPQNAATSSATNYLSCLTTRLRQSRISSKCMQSGIFCTQILSAA